MLPVIEATIPVFAIVILGFGLRKSGFIESGSWGAVEDLCFYVFFPALLAKTMIKADLGNNRFPGVVPIAQMTVYVGTIIAMVVGGISYISSNLSSAQLSPRLTGLEQKNVTIESRLNRASPALGRIDKLENVQTLLKYRVAQLEKRPDITRLMMRPRLN